jgi:carbamoyltransferase
MHHKLEKTEEPLPRNTNLYLGIDFTYTPGMINQIASQFKGVEVLEDIHSDQVSQILRDKNIVALFQGSSEVGPRALGNRSIIFDPTYQDGKDFVNHVKRREYFRPFAGTILHEHVNEWFDMRGLDESPNMMYAVNCQPGVEKKIPSIIHVDGTCRIQTVKQEQNPLFYELISEFYKLSGVPILFNTSFNLGGEPMVETLNDAIHTLVNSDIEYLYLPEYNILITAENQPKEF